MTKKHAHDVRFYAKLLNFVQDCKELHAGCQCREAFDDLLIIVDKKGQFAKGLPNTFQIRAYLEESDELVNAFTEVKLHELKEKMEGLIFSFQNEQEFSKDTKEVDFEIA